MKYLKYFGLFLLLLILLPILFIVLVIDIVLIIYESIKIGILGKDYYDKELPRSERQYYC